MKVWANPRKALALIGAGILTLVSACASDVGRPAQTPSPSAAPLTVVLIGDSIGYGQEDCDGCTTFVDLYAAALSRRPGTMAVSENVSTHDGLTGAGLLERLETEDFYREAVARADILIISILHNDTTWASDTDTCDGNKGDPIDFSKYQKPCVTEAVETAGQTLEKVLVQARTLRGDKPTVRIVPTIFNDWIEPAGTPRETVTTTKFVLDQYAATMCRLTRAAGAVCLDLYHDFNGPDGLKPVGDLASDLTHPSAEGHQRIATLLDSVDISEVMNR